MSSSVWFTTSGGARIAVRDWAPPAKAPLRGMVVLVHGLGEHSGRYESLAQRLISWGFAVRGYDHYGHGQSDGPRGGLDHDDRLLDDLAHVLNDTITRTAGDVPLILLGHSLGGLVAAHAVARERVKVDALVLSSPALDPGLSSFQKALVATLPRIVPNLRVDNGLALPYLSHDAGVVQAYREDPLCHRKVAARLARFIADAGAQTLQKAARWSVPTLLLWAGADRLVAPAGSRGFAAAAPKEVVRSREFEALYHELFNESPELAQPVFDALRYWLGVRYPQDVSAPMPVVA
ncbi:alpha/beta hydrolase [Diaphorobacter sp. HDW4A]|uniref:alpha/beta hydrolase n=1 Tax=Diaphorobacter sp. HDW4A TaxID=2714924 RepID=UPI001409183C|nr:alpha/beta hydrolase [Diaphorobacter sp. HDW4A]QIL82390.1 alpha/beta hydrolase [Diaphorobacter sp. HDW4A]